MLNNCGACAGKIRNIRLAEDSIPVELKLRRSPAERGGPDPAGLPAVPRDPAHAALPREPPRRAAGPTAHWLGGSGDRFDRANF